MCVCKPLVSQTTLEVPNKSTIKTTPNRHRKKTDKTRKKRSTVRVISVEIEKKKLILILLQILADQTKVSGRDKWILIPVALNNRLFMNGTFANSVEAFLVKLGAVRSRNNVHVVEKTTRLELEVSHDSRGWLVLQ